MKPIQTLTWAVSAPILLFAGASHAVLVSDLTDPTCNNGAPGSFVLDGSSYIKCSPPLATVKPTCSVTAPSPLVVGISTTISADCNPGPISSYIWTSTGTGAPVVSGQSAIVTFAAAGTYTYKVRAVNQNGEGADSVAAQITVNPDGGGGGTTEGVCPSTYVVPLGTRIIVGDDASAIGINKNFQKSFNTPGVSLDTSTGKGEIKAYEFTNTYVKVGAITGAEGGSQVPVDVKDWSLSLCPGDFSGMLGARCVQTGWTGANLYYSTDGSKGCKIPVNAKIYLNVKSGNPAVGAGWVMSNKVTTKLP